MNRVTHCPECDGTGGEHLRFDCRRCCGREIGSLRAADPNPWTWSDTGSALLYAVAVVAGLYVILAVLTGCGTGTCGDCTCTEPTVTTRPRAVASVGDCHCEERPCSAAEEGNA
ncbi:MAG: hypothetical protein QN187_17930 [Armatimonadota bacterium]|nr:hypothetical protein [Armatimonadota bacterium]